MNRWTSEPLCTVRCGPGHAGRDDFGANGDHASSDASVAQTPLPLIGKPTVEARASPIGVDVGSSTLPNRRPSWLVQVLERSSAMFR